MNGIRTRIIGWIFIGMTVTSSLAASIPARAKDQTNTSICQTLLKMVEIKRCRPVELGQELPLVTLRNALMNFQTQDFVFERTEEIPTQGVLTARGNLDDARVTHLRLNGMVQENLNIRRVLEALHYLYSRGSPIGSSGAPVYYSGFSDRGSIENILDHFFALTADQVLPGRMSPRERSEHYDAGGKPIVLTLAGVVLAASWYHDLRYGGTALSRGVLGLGTLWGAAAFAEHLRYLFRYSRQLRAKLKPKQSALNELALLREYVSAAKTLLQTGRGGDFEYLSLPQQVGGVNARADFYLYIDDMEVPHLTILMSNETESDLELARQLALQTGDASNFEAFRSHQTPGKFPPPLPQSPGDRIRLLGTRMLAAVGLGAALLPPSYLVYHLIIGK